MSETKWACPCMETMYQNLKKRIGTDKLYFTNTREFGSITSGKVVSKPEPLRIAFEVKGKNGKPLSKLQTSFVSFDYCPFCGDKYGEIK